MALKQALALLDRIVPVAGHRRLSDVAPELGIPMSTAYRLIATLEEHGYVVGLGGGRYVGGPKLAQLTTHIRPIEVLAAVARPILSRLARETKKTVHLGVLQSDMVTYLIKESPGADALFTRETMQLEAYCSGIGKVLLAALPEKALAAYLSAGPFVPLTQRTIVAPDALRSELRRVRARGYAQDNFEVEDRLCCLAVPLMGGGNATPAAVSIASYSETPSALLKNLPLLRRTSMSISKRLGATSVACREA